MLKTNSPSVTPVPGRHRPQSQIKADQHMITPRQSGAPKGNKNARKHGLYSKFIRLDDDRSMKSMSDKDPKDELAMARVRLAYAMEELSSAADIKEKLAWDSAAHRWLETIVNIKLKSKEDGQTPTVFDSLFDAMRAANERQGVK